MKLRRTDDGPVLTRDDRRMIVPMAWDDIFRHPNPVEYLAGVDGRPAGDLPPLAPIEGQEVWAAGVTYYVSRDARIEESADAGWSDLAPGGHEMVTGFPGRYEMVNAVADHTDGALAQNGQIRTSPHPTDGLRVS
jgi:hypothetical protein